MVDDSQITLGYGMSTHRSRSRRIGKVMIQDMVELTSRGGQALMDEQQG